LPVTGAGIIKGSRLCNFETGKEFLLLSHQNELDRVLEVIRKNPGYWVEIEGFASRAGDTGSNQTLSEKRAKSVRSYLEQGVTKA
jgi:outer membrane protein OmpA-like peptidoglycan-associated protein